MKITLRDAEERLADLVKRAEEGEEVILTRDGEPTVRLVPIPSDTTSRDRRREVLEEARRMGRSTAEPGPSAARSQDFLYDEDGLPS